MSKELLIKITNNLLKATEIAEEIKHTKKLALFLENISIIKNRLFYEVDKTEIPTSAGIALSEYDAKECIFDTVRTCRFLKGIYAAIHALKLKFPNQKLNVLYAGCGPYGTLLTPILPLLNENEFEFTFIDINPHSINSLTCLLKDVGLTNYNINILLCDALKYTHPTSNPLHLIITETMFEALIREPQVALTAKLAPQLIEGGLFLPEQITIKLKQSFFSNEYYYKGNDDELTAILNTKKEEAGETIATVFSLNRENCFSALLKNESYCFESDYFHIPALTEKMPDLILSTELSIFENIVLPPGTSYITNPYCLASLYNLKSYEKIKLIYSFKNNPNWRYQLQ